MGGLGLMDEQITQKNHDDLGCDGWEISAHGGSAPDHEPFQGKQYNDKQYRNINNSLHRRIGTLNCGHSAMPIIMGVNDPQYTPAELEDFRKKNAEGVTIDGKYYTLYEATQRQRSIERSIRKRKHHILIDEQLGDTEKLQQDQIRLQILKQEYHRFSKAAGLPEQYERMEKAGFTWKHGKAAEKATESVLHMSKPTATENDWSQALPREVSKEERAEIIQYAADRGIIIPGLKVFDGEPELLKSSVDALCSIRDRFLTGKKLTLSISRSLPDEEFAETTGNHITLNGKMLRNRRVTEENIAAGGVFASSKLEDIAVHEYGHVIATAKGNKGIEIARKTCYNVYGKEVTVDEVIETLCNEVSTYSVTYSSKSKDRFGFDSKRFKEIIPEVLAKNNSSPTAFTTEFAKLLEELF